MTTVALMTSIAYSLPNFRRTLIEALVARGVRVLALAPDYDERVRARVSALGAEPINISLARAGVAPGRDVADTARLWRLFRTTRPDALLAYFAKPVIYGIIAAAAAGVPRRIAMLEGLGYIFADDGARSVKRRAIRRISETLYRPALALTDSTVFLNQEDRALFVERGLVKPEKAINIGGVGVKLDDYQASPGPTDPVTFILAARLLREKGVIEYVEAARLVKARRPDTRFVLLGGPDLNPTGLTPAEVQAWVDEGTIEWPGHVDDVRDRVAGASVFVLPSFYREGVPRSIQEAMALGKPIITTDQVGCRDTVEEGVNGFLVPQRQIVPLAEAMMRFVDQPALTTAMGAASRRMAEERYDVARTDRLLIDLLLG